MRDFNDEDIKQYKQYKKGFILENYDIKKVPLSPNKINVFYHIQVMIQIN